MASVGRLRCPSAGGLRLWRWTLAGDGTRQFLAYLVSDKGPKPAFIRVVDKPMVIVTPTGAMPSTTVSACLPARARAIAIVSR